MAKHILIPTDFSLQSLKPVKHAAEQLAENGKLNIVLFHLLAMPTSIPDLLFLRQKTQKLASQNFKDACLIIKNKYSSSITDIQYRIFYGSSASVFRNHLDANHIDTVVFDSTLALKKTDKDTIDPVALFKKCGREVIDVSHDAAYRNSITVEMPELMELLTGE